MKIIKFRNTDNPEKLEIDVIPDSAIQKSGKPFLCPTSQAASNSAQPLRYTCAASEKHRATVCKQILRGGWAMPCI